MKTSYIYIAYTLEKTITGKDGKQRVGYIAAVEKVNSNSNLISVLAAYGDSLKYAHAFSSRQQAHEVADFWNESYIKNGTYLFE